MQTIRILLADDHQTLTDSLGSLLSDVEDFEVIGKVHEGRSVLDFLKFNSPNVVVLDIGMPGIDGIEVLKEIRKTYSSIKVVILTSYYGEGYIEQVMCSGANAFVLKKDASEEVIKAIREVSTDNEFYSSSILPKIIKFFRENELSGKESSKLTKREKEVLRLIGEGKTATEIADVLFIASTTVDTHRRNLLTKLGLRNSLELVRYAIFRGYVSFGGWFTN